MVRPALRRAKQPPPPLEPPAIAPPASAAAPQRPFVVGLGGALRPQSSTERLLRLALAEVEARGGETQMFDGRALDLPLYAPDAADRAPGARALVEALRRADAVVLASPAYHGGLSGQVKNALDYVEDLSGDARPYLDGRPVGCIAVGAGWQGAVNTLAALRNVVHALRGWPTPLGVAAVSTEPLFTAEGALASPALGASLGALAHQVLHRPTPFAAQAEAPTDGR